MDAARARTVLQAIYRETREENLTFMAGSVAYHAFVSLLPLVVLLVLALDSLGQRTLVEAVFALTGAVLTDGGRNILEDSLGTGRRVSGVSILGIAVLVWATLRIFRGLDQAFSDVYETESENTLPDQVGDGVLVLVVVVMAVVAVATIRNRLVFEGPAGMALGSAFVVAALTLVFLPMYYVFPDEELRVVEVLPGTALAAAGVTALESLFRFYVEFSSTTDYGVLGGVVLLLTWLYFNGLVILLGAVVNAVLTNRTDNFDIDPVVGSYSPATDEGADLAGRLERLRERIEAGDSVTVSVGVDSVVLPPPREVTVDSGDDGDGAGIAIRWDGSGPRSGDGVGPGPGTGSVSEPGTEAGPAGESTVEAGAADEPEPRD